MESLATILRRIPIFADLPAGSFAKIIADLREERHPAGAVICYEGEAAGDFYIIKSGECEILVNLGSNQREVVAVNRAYQWFGERALFSDRPRSATVVARTEVELWRLTKEKFDDLIEANPSVILHFTKVIGDRLYETNQQLSKIQAAFGVHVESVFCAQPPRLQQFLIVRPSCRLSTRLLLPVSPTMRTLRRHWQRSIDTWVIHQLTPMLEPLTASPARFLLLLALAIFAARFILPSFPLVSLLTVTVAQVALGAGIHPLPLALVICTSASVWFLPYQSTYYLALYFGTKEKAFSHGQVRPLAWSYGLIYLIAIAVAIPYWRALRLLP